jgi:hypothetical protein
MAAIQLPTEFARDESAASALLKIGEDGNIFSLRLAFNKSVSENIGILSLTEDPKNLLMWAHYADSHQGGVVEFDSSHPFFTARHFDEGFTSILKKVKYRRRRPILPILHFKKYKIFYNDYLGGWLALLNTADPLFFTKGLEWRYEREWRLIRQLREPSAKRASMSSPFLGGHIPDDYYTQRPSDAELHSVPTTCIRSVILGAKSIKYTGRDHTIEDDVWGLLRGKSDGQHVRLLMARVHEENFGLVIYDLQNRDEVANNVSRQELKMRDEGFCGVGFK